MNIRLPGWMRMVRLPNLVIVAVTMLIFGFGFIYPTLKEAAITPVLWLKDLYLLVFITVSVAAFGYLHNDLMDRRTDEINNGGRIIRYTSKWIGIGLLLFFALAPALLALSLALEIAKPGYFFYYLLVVGLIFAYNVWLKRLPLIGNVVVAGLCAGVIGILLIGESSSIAQLKISDTAAYDRLMFIGISLMIFAFALTLMREMVKDMEDLDGDLQTGHRTIPVVFGIRGAKKITMAVWSVYLLFVAYAARLFYLDTGRWVWVFILIVFPAFFIPVVLIRAGRKKDFWLLSQYFKVYMLAGLVFLIYLKCVL